jgi:hypothetical protein
MRNLILPMLLLATIIVKAQPAAIPIDKETGHVVYTEVVNVNGTSAEDLYKRMYYWFRTFYVNPSSVIEADSRPSAYIKGKHAVIVYDTINGKANKHGLVKYTIEVAAKDGRYRYTINEIFYDVVPKLYVEKWLDDKAPNKLVNYNYLNQVDSFMGNLVTKLKATMAEPVPEKKKDDF